MAVQKFGLKQAKKLNVFTNQMWALNVKDEFNANMFTEWQPGRVRQMYLP